MMGISHQDLNLLTRNSNFSRLDAYIFYQPGDIHDISILEAACSALWIRIGDLHHLINPLTRSISFVRSAYRFTEKLLLNTNPAFTPLFRYIFPIADTVPISELTIKEGILAEAKTLAKHACRTTSRKRLVYIGSRESPFHPRRTFWINTLLNATYLSRTIDHIETLAPTEWLECCSAYTTALAPSLNCQWSHNIFVPNLVGTRILTDCQALPSYPYYRNPKTSILSTCMFSYTLSSFKAEVINSSASLDAFSSRTIADYAHSRMEESDYTFRSIYSSQDIDPNQRQLPLFATDPSAFQRIMIAANIFEVLQEITRAMVIYDRLNITCKSKVIYDLLSRYFPHPRLVYSYNPVIPSRKHTEESIEVHGHELTTGKTEFLLTFYARIDSLDPASIQPSYRKFEIKNIRSYGMLQRRLKETVSSNYILAEFDQQLLNSIEIVYR